MRPNSGARVETIERNARAQQQLIEDLLDVSRIITGKLRLDVRPLSPAVLSMRPVESVVPLRTQKRFSSKFSAIRISVPSPATRDDCASCLELTLKRNQVHSARRPGPLKLQRTSSHVQISVTDSGRVSGKSSCLTSSSVSARLTLKLRVLTEDWAGVAIVRQLVELHGGTVE